jgi:hypothetical protein
MMSITPKQMGAPLLRRLSSEIFGQTQSAYSGVLFPLPSDAS